MPMTEKDKKKCDGFTIIEALVFVAILSVMVGLLTMLLASQLGAWGRARLDRAAADGGSLILDRISHEVELAAQVVTSSSAFGDSPGRLTLVSFVTPTSTATTTVSIQLLDNAITLKRAGAPTTTLNATSTLVVPRFAADLFAATTSRGIRVEITVRAARGSYSSQKTMTTAALLMGK